MRSFYSILGSFISKDVGELISVIERSFIDLTVGVCFHFLNVKYLNKTIIKDIIG